MQLFLHSCKRAVYYDYFIDWLFTEKIWWNCSWLLDETIFVTYFHAYERLHLYCITVVLRYIFIYLQRTINPLSVKIRENGNWLPIETTFVASLYVYKIMHDHCMPVYLKCIIIICSERLIYSVRRLKKTATGNPRNQLLLLSFVFQRMQPYCIPMNVQYQIFFFLQMGFWNNEINLM